MPEMTLHRNYVLRTTKGHCIRFIKNEPVFVPPICLEDAVAIGALAVTDGEDDILPDDEQAVVLTQAERKAAIINAFDVMTARKERSDFTGNGLPNPKKLEQIVGFEVHSKERDNAWREYRVAMENPGEDE